MGMLITDHASDRIRERVGLPKRSVQKNADKALSEGIAHAETSGRLRKYFDYLFLSHGTGANIRIYGNHVYIFTTERLVTVLTLPGYHRKAVQKLFKNRRAERRFEDGDMR